MGRVTRRQCLQGVWLAFAFGVGTAAIAQGAELPPGRVFETVASVRIQGAVPWGAVLISEGRELLVAEQRLGKTSFSVREAASGKELRRLRARTLVGNGPTWAISSNGARVALAVPDASQRSMISGAGTAVVVIDVATDQEVRRLPIPKNRDSWGIAISSNGRRVAAIASLAHLHVWDVDSGAQLQEIETVAASSIEFSPDATQLVTTTSLRTGLFGGGIDAIAEVWSVASGRRITEVKVKDAGFNRAIFSPDGKHFLTANRGGSSAPRQVTSTATLWDANTGREVMAFGRGGPAATNVSFSPDGTLIATTSTDRRARVWSAATGSLVGEIAGHGAVGGTVRLEVAPGAFIQLADDTANSIFASFAREGDLLVTSGLEGTVRVWVNAAKQRESFTAALGLAQKGDADAMHTLVAAYREGRGVAKNAAESTAWLKRAADAGHAPANVELGSLLVTGGGERQDCIEGGARLRKASSQGNASAAIALDAVLSPVGGRQGAAAMSPQIQADLLETQIIDVLKRSEYPAFLANLCAFEALGHAERLPVEARRELVYHRAVGLQAAGKPRAALAALTQYLNEAGNAGASYTAAIRLLRPLQEEVK